MGITVGPDSGRTGGGVRVGTVSGQRNGPTGRPEIGSMTWALTRVGQTLVRLREDVRTPPLHPSRPVSDLEHRTRLVGVWTRPHLRLVRTDTKLSRFGVWTG